MNKRGQVKEGLSIFVILVAVGLFLKFILPAINAASTGNIDVLVDALIPLFIFAIFFEFIRRFFA